MLKKSKIKELAKKAGFDICRITDKIEFAVEKNILKKREKRGYWPSPFFNKDINKVCDIKQIFSDAETAVVLAVSYQQKADNNPYLSKYIGKNDYHIYIYNMLENLIKMLQKEAEKPFKFQKFVDTAPFMERALARNAGVGFTGKNSFIINPEYGSFIFLAEIMLNLKIEPDKKLNIDCGSCRKCIDSCPAEAIIKPYLTDFSRCISYLTQKRGILTLKERKIIGKNIWGCDVCQEVCPYNKNVKHSRHPELKLDKLFVIEYFINIDRKHPPLELKEMALSWRGFRILQRNAIIAAANSRAEKYFTIIKNKLEDRSPIIRFYAVWALMEINESKAYKILEELLYIEDSKVVKAEIKRLLNDNY
ncbi:MULTISPECIES: tRNA epoxyqueuosine(34) reductase QueG [unclassified Halanaerobium]|uniref:tRNA epoxyqueuosine(34) reductase QueG n=1 Tax=unclassified Halanaerobium TaxID=2641197 RepID=UPI000DF23754|nr:MULTISPECIES: tRNA epoxyqueuosine(34) reductase QueG [unclassified Halanaerobium]RCW51470.1 epoxyqueuosine reductase [Halanaerobium sp. MA284_MarDTE_T2]RCW89258.1 epoxyqueuosine reductase [Halanaerobium sp. DL-01]